jgi:DNA polymerase-4
VTENKIGMPSGTIIARQIKQKIRETTGLTTSAGVDYSQKKIRLTGLTVGNAQDLDRPEAYRLEFDSGDI